MKSSLLVDEFIDSSLQLDSPEDLEALLSAFTVRMGFDYFALTHHVDLSTAGRTAIHVHNYPARWAEYYTRRARGVSDPVRRASHRTGVGFTWDRLPSLVHMTKDDHCFLALAHEHGLGDGFTVPANVPGESNGSVSFAVKTGAALPDQILPAAQLIGVFAFEGARKLWRTREPPLELPILTDRQRDCVLWAARGKSDWEISVILSISMETVVRHIKHARQRYGVHKRTSLLMRTLMDGTISLADVHVH